MGTDLGNRPYILLKRRANHRYLSTKLKEKLEVQRSNLRKEAKAENEKLRNAHRPKNRMGQALKRALTGRQKLLLTATPLQNSLIELYGLSTVIDEHLFGDDKAFRKQYMNSKGDLPELRERLDSFVHRTLRKQVLAHLTRCEGLARRRCFFWVFGAGNVRRA